MNKKTSFLGYFTPPPLPLLSETGQKSQSPINYSNHFWEPPLHLLSQFFECKKLHTLDEKVINKRVILITAPIPHMIKIPSTSNMDSFQCRQTLRVVQRLEFNRRQSFTLETNQLENNMNMCCISLNKFLSQFSDFKFSKPINCIPTKTTNK